jgi:uncharacterized membrane protein (DUF2068 family)
MMSTQADITAPGLSAVAVEPPLKRAPTLYAIIFFKLIKGVLFFAFGLAIYFQVSQDLPAEWSDLLNRPFVVTMFERLRIHPENKFFQHIAEQIANVTETQVHVWAMGTMIFSLFPLVEGIGLLYRISWAGWLTIGESAFFVPIELYELARKYSPYMLLVMVINIVIVWYLYANLQWLFHHHHRKN